MGRGKGEAAGVSLLRQPLDHRPTGIAEPQQLGHLVERLAGGVVERLPQQPVLAPGGHVEQHGVPAAHQQGHERRRQVGVFERRGEEMPFEVIHAEQRAIEAEGERLAVGDADEQGADEAGTGGHGDPVELAEADPRVGERAVHHRADGADVRPARQLGHHSAEDAVHVLREDHVARDRADAAVRPEHRRGGLVAGCLDAEDPAGHASSRAGPGVAPRCFGSRVSSSRGRRSPASPGCRAGRAGSFRGRRSSDRGARSSRCGREGCRR